jgi:hypothetical protein
MQPRVVWIHNEYNGVPLIIYNHSIDGWVTWEDDPILGNHYHIVQVVTFGSDGVFAQTLIKYEVLLLSARDFKKLSESRKNFWR